MKKRFLFFLFFLLFFHSSFLSAFPDKERPINGTKPLTFSGMIAQATQLAVTTDNRYLVVAMNSSVFIIDLASFSLLSSQINTFAASVGGIAIQPNTYNLYIVTTDKKMYFTQVNAPAADPTSYDMAADVGASGLPGLMVAGKEIGDNNLFFIDTVQFKVFVFDTSLNKIKTSVSLTANTTSYTPTDIDIASFPSRFNTSRTVDRIFVSTKEGTLWYFDEDTLNGIPVNILAKGTVISSLSIDPTNDVLYLIDQTNTQIDVVSTTDPTTATMVTVSLDHVDLNPIKPFVNTALTGSVATQVINPVGTRLYVSGQNGLTIMSSVINSANPTTGVYTILDMDGSSAIPNVNGPLLLSGIPGPLIATSANDGYVFASDQGGGISVVSANPFVTINSVTPVGPYTTTNSSFVINFNTDEICAGGEYSVRANGNLTQNGALLLPTVTFAGTEVNPITTGSINVVTNSSILNEGTNEIFIFVQDCASSEGPGYQNEVGRDMTTITVDLPPPDVTIQGVGFGTEKGLVTIIRLTQADINHYNAFVLQATDQVNPSCPGGLDFSTAPVYNVEPQPSSGDSITIMLPHLTNGVYYCVAVEAVDNSSQTSPNRVASSTPILPEQTVGIVERSGEKGCSLSSVPSNSKMGLGVLILFTGFSFLLMTRIFLFIPSFILRKGHKKKIITFIFSFLLLFASFIPALLQAEEASPKTASIGFEGGFFAPKNSVLKEFLSDCCNGFYNLYGGAIFDSKYEVSLGIGFLYENRAAVGAITGRVSGDHFNFFVMPVSTSFNFRAQFVENQILVPYTTVGLDYMYFRENLQGNVTNGLKVGYHAGGGLMVLLEWFDSMNDYLEGDLGINDTYLTLGAKWMQIDNFGGEGLKFNGFLFSAGLLFEF